MIPVTPAPEPPGFNAQVRVPGNLFLAPHPQPTSNQWRHHDYWRSALTDLHTAYRGICSYCSSSTPRSPSGAQEGSSVDHFVPKSVVPSQAYEWGNFRLSRPSLNNYKDDNQDVLDPFTLQPGWFHLNFTTFLIQPNPAILLADRARVSATISRLRLNADSRYVNERLQIVRAYCLGSATFDQLLRTYPFIASEMTRQDFDTTLRRTMAARFGTTP